MLKLLQFGLLLALITLAKTGYIQTGDLIANFNNIQYLDQIQFPFKLDNPLSADGALVIDSPVSLGSTTLIANWQIHFPNKCSEDVWQSTTMMQANTLSQTTYMINFGLKLEADVWYTIRIYLQSTLSSPGILSTFKIYTVTRYINSAKVIKIDNNQVLGQLNVLPIPLINSQISFRLDGIELEKVGGTQLMQIDFQPETEFGGRVLIILDEDFLVTSLNTCKFVANTNLESITPPLGTYTCSAYQNDYRKLLITLDTNLQKSKAYTLELYIQNPSFITNSKGFSLYIIKHDTNTILETFSKNSVFKTSTVQFKDLKAKFAWGYDVTNLNANDLSFPFAIYKDKAATSHKVYNTLQFEFRLEEDTTPDLNYAIKLNLSPGTPILQSLTENLPGYENREVYCYLDATPSLICTNIGRLLASMTYSIGIKVNFASTVTSLPVTFGQYTGFIYKSSLSAYDWNKPYIDSSVAATLAAATLIENKDLVKQASTNGYQGLHTSPLINSDMSQATEGYGVKYDPDLTSQHLRLQLMWDDNHFHTSGTASYDQTLGIEVYLNSKIFKLKEGKSMEIEDCGYGTTQCVRDNIPLVNWITNSATTCTACNMVDLNDGSVRGRFWMKTSSAQTFFSDNAGSNIKEISFSSIVIKQPSSVLADQYVSDVYVGTVDATTLVNKDVYDPAVTTQDTFNNTVTLTSTNYTTRLLFNSYTVSLASAMANLKSSYAIFWTGSSSEGQLDGQKFPSVIRINGYLTDVERSNVRRLEIYFNNVVPFFKESVGGFGSTTSREIYCSGTLRLQCFSDPGQDSDNTQTDVYAESKITINITKDIQSIDAGNTFQIIIPVKTVEQQNELTLHLATVKQHPDFPGKNYFILDNMKKQYLTMTPGSAWIDHANTDQDYSYIFANTPTIGSRNPQTSINVTYTGALQTKNTGSLTGSGFTIVGDQDIFEVSPTVTPNCTSFLAGTTPDKQCIIYNYYETTSSKQKYGLFCPLEEATTGSTTISCTELFIPFDAGSVFEGTWSGISTNTGNMVSYQQDPSATGVFSPNVLTLETSSISVQIQLSTKIKFGVTTATQISKNCKIKLTFSSTSQLTSSGACEIATSAVTACSVTINSATAEIVIGVNTDTGNWPAGTTFDVTIYNVRVTQGQATYPDVVFQAATSLTNNEVIDQTNTTAGKLVFVSSITPTITLSNPTFLTNSQSAIDIFSLDFSINREIFKYDELKINLGALSSVNAQGAENCKILTENGTPSLAWSTCDSGTLQDIRLKPIKDISVSEKFTLKFPRITNMVATITPGITAIMSDGASNQISSQTTETAYKSTNAVLDLRTFSVTKTLHGLGMTPIFNFSIQTKENNFNSSEELILIYPDAYNQDLCSPISLSCTINSQPVLCECKESFQIRVRGLPNVQTNASLTFLTVEGVEQGSFSTVGKFFLGLRMIGQNAYLEQGQAADLVNPTKAVHFKTDITEFRDIFVSMNGNVSVRFTMTTDAIQATTHSLILTVPPEYGNLRVSGLACSITKQVAAGATETVVPQYPNCTSTARSIVIPLSKNLMNSLSYELLIQGVLGPEFESCKSKKPLFGIVDSSSVFKYMSPGNSLNMKSPVYTQKSGNIYLAFYKDGKVLLGNERIITVPAGVYDKSQLVTLKPLTGLFQHFLTIKAKNNTIRFLETEEGKDPGTLIIRPGDSEITLHITSTISSTALIILELEIITEQPADKKLYAPIPQLQVFVQTEQKMTIFLLETSLDVTHGGISRPLKIDFSQYIPVLQIQIGVTFENKDLGISISDYVTDLSVSADDPVALIMLKSDDKFGKIADKTKMVLTLESKRIIFQPNSININILPGISGIASKFTTKLKPSIKSISQDFQIQVNIPGILFWSNQLANSFDASFQYILDGLKNQNIAKSNKIFDQTVGFEYVEQERIVQIKGLQPNRQYVINLYFMNSMALVSDTSTLSYKTLDNGGQLSRIDLSFLKPLSKVKKALITCLITEFFAFRPNRIMSYHLQTCDSLSKPRDLIVTNDITVAQINNSYSYSYYVYPEQRNEQDRSNKKVMQGINQPSYRDWMINKNLSYFLEAGFTENINDNLPSFLEEIKLKSGRNWVSINNIVLLDNGYIVAVVVNSNITNFGEKVLGSPANTSQESTTLKEIVVGTYEVKNQHLFTEKIELLKGKGSIISRFIGFYQGQKLEYNFTNLKEFTYYTVYYVATNEDPMFFLERTPIFNLTIKTTQGEVDEQQVETVLTTSGTIIKSIWILLFCVIGLI